jgi:DNA-binding NtrC family response regulator
VTARRILVVDDDPNMVQTLCDILEMRGWETVRAFNGLEAVRQAADKKVDVVLMDVKMPQMNGVEALQQMKKTNPAIRIILMTAYAAPDLLAQAEEAGVVSIMRKPIDLPSVLTLLEAASKGARSVLVVDDDAAYLRTMSDLLSRHGIIVMQARTLAEALERFERQPPAAVLIDLRLDGINMSEHLLAFREMSPGVLLVLHSGYVEELARAVEGAPQGLIAAAFTKPMAVERLLEFLDGHGRS